MSLLQISPSPRLVWVHSFIFLYEGLCLFDFYLFNFYNFFQYIELIAPIEKQRRLEQILRSQEPGSKVIIFCTTKRMCDQLSRSITRQFGAAAIHGDKSQGERDYVLNQFRTGKSPILVATDVAARGLDIKDIRLEPPLPLLPWPKACPSVVHLATWTNIRLWSSPQPWKWGPGPSHFQIHKPLLWLIFWAKPGHMRLRLAHKTRPRYSP